MLYQPLTKAQEEKYRRFKAEKEKPAKTEDTAEVTEIGAHAVKTPHEGTRCEPWRITARIVSPIRQEQ